MAVLDGLDWLSAPQHTAASALLAASNSEMRRASDAWASLVLIISENYLSEGPLATGVMRAIASRPALQRMLSF